MNCLHNLVFTIGALAAGASPQSLDGLPLDLVVQNTEDMNIEGLWSLPTISTFTPSDYAVLISTDKNSGFLNFITWPVDSRPATTIAVPFKAVEIESGKLYVLIFPEDELFVNRDLGRTAPGGLLFVLIRMTEKHDMIEVWVPIILNKNPFPGLMSIDGQSAWPRIEDLNLLVSELRNGYRDNLLPAGCISKILSEPRKKHSSTQHGRR